MKTRRFREVYFYGLSVVIGLLAALGAVLFRWLIELFQSLFWAGGANFYYQVINSPWWLKLLVPVSAGLVAGPVITFLVPEAKGPGVPEVILSVATRQSTIRHRVTVLKAAVTSLLIGAGASVGREGPIVQIGASIGSSLAQLFRLDPSMRRVFLASGAAAGIAATFNAPIAGTLFAVEIILLDVDVAHITHIIISSISASVISRFFWGEFPAFITAGFKLTNYWELGIYLVLGIAAGLVSIAFVRLTFSIDTVFGRVKIYDWLKPAVGGLGLGLFALAVPQVLGVGYETINTALGNSLVLNAALMVLFAKMAATAMCIGSGMSGGIFAPSLVMGSALGTLAGLGALMVFPGVGLSASDYALAGMGAVVAGTTLAPITAILTIFELTYSYQIILPLMVACISSTLVAKLLFGYSAYEMKLIRQGINVVRGHVIGILRHTRAKDLMAEEFETIGETTPLGEALDRVTASPWPHFVVLKEKGELAGVMSLRDLRPYLADFDRWRSSLSISDIMIANVITIQPEENLERALNMFERHKVSFMPVVEPENPLRVLGILKRDDVLRAYRETLEKDGTLSSPEG